MASVTRSLTLQKKPPQKKIIKNENQDMAGHEERLKNEGWEVRVGPTGRNYGKYREKTIIFKTFNVNKKIDRV